MKMEVNSLWNLLAMKPRQDLSISYCFICKYLTRTGAQALPPQPSFLSVGVNLIGWVRLMSASAFACFFAGVYVRVHLGHHKRKKKARS